MENQIKNVIESEQDSDEITKELTSEEISEESGSMRVVVNYNRNTGLEIRSMEAPNEQLSLSAQISPQELKKVMNGDEVRTKGDYHFPNT